MKNKLTIVIGLFLYAVFTFGLFLHQSEPSLSILVGEHPSQPAKGVLLLAGKKINFEITTPHDGLGIIAVRFQTFRRINDDILSFRLRPKGATVWTYESNYKTDQFQDHELFPFGFPLQPNSRGKTYEVELESLSGSDGNYVSIDKTNPVIVSKYHYPPTSQSTSLSMNIQFGFRKAFSIFTNSSTVYPLSVYFSPLLLYLLNLVSISRKKRPSYFSIVIPVMLVVAHFFLNLSRPYHWELTLLLVWLTYLIVTKASYRISVVLSLLAALYLLIRTLENNPTGVDQVAQWLYYCLLLTIIQIKLKLFD